MEGDKERRGEGRQKREERGFEKERGKGVVESGPQEERKEGRKEGRGK